MTWQAIWLKTRERATTLRARINFRVVRRVAFVVTALSCVVISIEALVRARLQSAASRIPTALYSRPIPWGGEGRRAPIALGAIADPLAEQRSPVSVEDVPRHLVDAVLAVEDKRFYDHHGLDVRRIGGALVANVRAGQIAQGGSTITQQLVKNLFLSHDRTPLRKLREAAIAVVLDARYDKRAILEAYLNEIYLGQDGARSIHGVGAAARFYFGKDVGKISLAESALLAGMIQAPNRFSPIRNERVTRRRRNLVLGLMAEQARVTQARADQAAKSRVGTRVYPGATLDARYFRDAALVGIPRNLPARGAAVYTTLDPTLQRSAERAVREGLIRFRGNDAQAALVAIDPRTGEVLALVGGRDYGASQFNRAVDARRQPGSAFKPIVALAALHREGNRAPAFTLASRIEDQPFRVATPSGPWEPSNYDRSYRGEVTMREAMEQSLNVPFARIGIEIGPERIVEVARRLGIASPLRPVPSIALGSSEVTLLELVRAYGVFATGGQLASTRMVVGGGALGVRAPKAGPPELVRVADAAETYLVTSALEGVISRGTARALDVAGRFGGLAGKTGTSNDARDAWFVAYSPSLVVGVWVGYDDGRSVGLTGAGAALPIVAKFLERAEPDDRWESFPVPDGIEVARVGGGGDEGWSWDCGGREVFLAGTAPDSDCDERERFWDDRHDRERSWEDRRGREWSRQLEGRAGRIVSQLLERLMERRSEDR